jgi:substrate-binding family protein
MRLRSVRASGIALAALLAASLLTGCGGSANPFPSEPQRLVTDDEFATDAALALGLHPSGAVGLGTRGWSPALAPLLAKADDLGGRTGGSANLDAIAGAKPDAILGPVALEREGWGGELTKIAPTAYYLPGKTWQASLRAVATALGRTGEASALIAALRLRADAIRGQLAGRTVALVKLAPPQSYSAANDDMPAAAVFERDLGIRNLHLRPQQYPSGCAPAPAPPRPCMTNNLYDGSAARFLSGSDALLLESAPRAAESFSRELPRAGARRVASAASFEDVGPLGVSYLYSALERAFGIDELHAGRGAVLTLVPGTRKLCWSTSTASRLSLQAAGAQPLILQSRTGCETVTPALASLFASTPSRARLGSAVVAAGPLSIVPTR